jgi:Flp pilus assembly pilin Flp
MQRTACSSDAQDVMPLPSSRSTRLAERGATFVEYALLMGLFAATSIAGINVINRESGDKVRTVSTSVGELPDVEGSVPAP